MYVVKRTFRYLKGTKEYGLQYKIDGDFELKVYNDVDWVGNVDDRKSTSEGSFFLRERLVTCINKKQIFISQSIIEVEYIVGVINYSNIIRIKQLLEGTQDEVYGPMTIYCDNTSAISTSKNPVMYSKTKQIPIKYHYLRERVHEKKVKLEYVNSKEKIIDILTKPLPKDTFKYLRGKVGVIAQLMFIRERCMLHQFMIYQVIYL